MARFEYVEWLLFWLLEAKSFRFEWDSGNRAKSEAKHGVSQPEVEEAFQLGQALPIGVQVRPIVAEERLAIVGPTFAGRMLIVVFTLRNGWIRPISARPAHKKEREQYEQVLRQIAERI
jgi:uncharacterized DUF497 family protein